MILEDPAYVKRQTDLLDAALAEATDFANALKDSLPKSLDAAALGVWEKAPFQLLTVREAMIWRTEEVARNACDAIKTDDLTVAAVLTRAVVESVAVIWKLRGVVERDYRGELDKMNNDLMSILGASRNLPERTWSYQILNFVDLIDKTVPGVREKYDDLSEIAHPNWQGVAGMYSTLDCENHTVNFGRNKRLHTGRKTQIAILLSVFLGLFERTYNEISELLPGWINQMNPI